MADEARKRWGVAPKVGARLAAWLAWLVWIGIMIFGATFLVSLEHRG